MNQVIQKLRHLAVEQEWATKLISKILLVQTGTGQIITTQKRMLTHYLIEKMRNTNNAFEISFKITPNHWIMPTSVRVGEIDDKLLSKRLTSELDYPEVFDAVQEMRRVTRLPT